MKSASLLRPIVEYEMTFILVFATSNKLSNSLAASSFPISFSHLHFGSTLKKEKFRKSCSSFFIPSVFISVSTGVICFSLELSLSLSLSLLLLLLLSEINIKKGINRIIYLKLKLKYIPKLYSSKPNHP
jgi:hypothetical protein